MGNAIRCLTQDATVMAMAIDSTDIVAEAERIHHPSGVVTAALGRLLTGASMMGLMLKGADDSVTLRVAGGGPVGTLLTVSDSYGNVRGYAQNPLADLPIRADNKLDVGGIVGCDGMLYVLRDTGGKEPYTGCTPLVSGEIAEDITSYYAESEQIPTACALGVLVNPDLTVKTAGGLLIQLLPFCPESVIDRIEKNMAALPAMTTMLSEGLTPQEICARALDGMPFDVVDEYQPTYRCSCSRKKVENAFIAMPEEDVRSLPDENGMTEVTCNFCDSVYRFTTADLENLLRRRKG